MSKSMPTYGGRSGPLSIAGILKRVRSAQRLVELLLGKGHYGLEVCWTNNRESLPKTPLYDFGQGRTGLLPIDGTLPYLSSSPSPGRFHSTTDRRAEALHLCFEFVVTTNRFGQSFCDILGGHDGNSENRERASTGLSGKGTQTPSPSPDPNPC